MVHQRYTNGIHSIDKNSIVKNSIDKNNIDKTQFENCVIDITAFYNKNIAITTESDILNIFEDYLIYGMESELIIYAIQLAVDNNRLDISYIVELLNKWKNNNIKTLLDAEFENLWREYPRKLGKPDALKHYKKHRKQTDYKEILDGLLNYIKYIEHNNISVDYIKHGSTWFSKQCWKDEYKIEQNQETKSQSQIEFERTQEILNG